MKPVKTSTLRQKRRARHWQVTMDWNDGLVEVRHHHVRHVFSVLGWGLLSQFPPFRYFPNISASPKHTLAIACHVYIWQVSPQLCCGDTCQIWLWFNEFNWYFYKAENFAFEEINERSFSNPHARTDILPTFSYKVWYEPIAKYILQIVWHHILAQAVKMGTAISASYAKYKVNSDDTDCFHDKPYYTGIFAER